MYRLLALLSLFAAGTAQAQYGWPYYEYPPGYPPQQPIYIPEPGHPADAPPSDGRSYPLPEPDYGYYAPSRPYAAPQAYPPPLPYPEVQTDPRSLARDLLAPQNAVRASVGDRPLLWSDLLADAARDWAARLIASGQFAHRPDDPYGENLYGITGGAASPEQVVAAWADEARFYDFRTNSCAGVCGHYTQIVWRATRVVGCAVASDATRQVWVCEYEPAGNVVGYRPF